MPTKKKKRTIAQSAKTGLFVSPETAKRRPATTIVQEVKSKKPKRRKR